MAAPLRNTVEQFTADGSPKLILAGEQSVEPVLSVSTADGGLLPLPSFNYTSSDTTKATVSAAGSISTTASAGSTMITASALLGGTNVTCDLEVVNLGTATAFRALAIDDVTGEPVDISGATVVVDCDNDGVNDSGDLVLGADGVVTGSDCGDTGTYNVTVFESEHNFLSVAGIPAALKDLLLPLSRRVAEETTAGFDGQLDFSVYEAEFLDNQSLQIKFGFAAPSIPIGQIFNFSLNTFLGPTITEDCGSDSNNVPAGCYDLNVIPGIDSLPIVALPGGVILGFGDDFIKSTFEVVGAPGRRNAWAWGGEVDLDTLLNSGLQDLLTGGLDFSVISRALNQLLPSFAYAFVGDLAMQQQPLSDWISYISEDPPYGDRFITDGPFERLDGEFQGAREALTLRYNLRQFTDVTAPALPDDPAISAKMDTMFAVTGVRSAGYGLVGLGLGANSDCTASGCTSATADSSLFDGVLNGQVVCDFDANECVSDIQSEAQATLPEGHIPVFSAEPRSGLELQEEVGVIVANTFRSAGDRLGARVTGFVQPGGFTETNTQNREFLGFPTFGPDACGRKYKAVSADGNTDVHIVTMTAPDTDISKRWNVFFFPATDGTEFVAPAVPAGNADPFQTLAWSERTDTTDEDAPPADRYPQGFATEVLDIGHVALDLRQEAGTLAEIFANNGRAVTAMPNNAFAFNLRDNFLAWAPTCQ